MEKFKPRITQSYIGDRPVNTSYVDRDDLPLVEYVEFMSVYEHEVKTAILEEKVAVLEAQLNVRGRPGPKL